MIVQHTSFSIRSCKSPLNNTVVFVIVFAGELEEVQQQLALSCTVHSMRTYLNKIVLSWPLGKRVRQLPKRTFFPRNYSLPQPASKRGSACNLLLSCVGR